MRVPGQGPRVPPQVPQPHEGAAAPRNPAGEGRAPSALLRSLSWGFQAGDVSQLSPTAE